MSFHKTALRDSRLVKTSNLAFPSFSSKAYESGKAASRSSTNAKWHGTKHRMRNAEAIVSEQWQNESSSRLTGTGSRDSPIYETKTHTGAIKTAQKPTQMGKIVKSVNVRQTTS